MVMTVRGMDSISEAGNRWLFGFCEDGGRKNRSGFRDVGAAVFDIGKVGPGEFVSSRRIVESSIAAPQSLGV